jgi:hypothetical protein
VTYNDSLRLEAKVNVSELKSSGTYNVTALAEGDILGISDFPVEVVSVTGSSVELEYRAWKENITSAGTYDTGYGFSVVTIVSGGVLAVNDTTGQLATSLGALIQLSGGEPRVVEEGGANIDLTYNETNKNYESVNVAGVATLDAENEKGLSNYGSVVTLGAGRETVEIVYPDEQVKARALVGELAPAPEQVVEKYTPILTPVGKLADKVDPTANHLILVGGTCVNELVAKFYNVTFPTCGEDAATAMNMSRDQAVIEVKKGVFATDKIAMVVAGWEAPHTRLASTLVQRYSLKETPPKGIYTDAAKVVIKGVSVEAPEVTPV